MTFDRNDKATIEAALAESKPGDPIVQAVTAKVMQIIDVYTQNNSGSGGEPDQLVIARPETVFDEVVLELSLHGIENALGQSVPVRWLDDLVMTQEERPDCSVAALVRVAAVIVSASVVAFVIGKLLF